MSVNLPALNIALEKLLTDYGIKLMTPLTITPLSGPIPVEHPKFDAFRFQENINLDFSIKANGSIVISKWSHGTLDNRRLVQELKEENDGTRKSSFPS